MEKEKYEVRINEILKNYEDEKDGIKKTRKKYLLVFLFSLIAAVVFMLLGSVSDVFIFFVIAAIVAGIVGLVLASKCSEKFEVLINKYNGIYYEKIYQSMIADELNATPTHAYTKTPKKKIKKNLGEIIESKTDVYNGVYEGRPFTVTSSKVRMITEVTTVRGNPVSYKDEVLFPGTEFSFKTSFRSDDRIFLDNSFNLKRKDRKKTDINNYKDKDLKRIKMDTDEFNMDVYSTSDLVAYKYLTAGRMMKFNEYAKLHPFKYIEIDKDEITTDMWDEILSMDYEPDFKHPQSLEGYDDLIDKAVSQAELIKQLISESRTVAGDLVAAINQ